MISSNGNGNGMKWVARARLEVMICNYYISIELIQAKSKKLLLSLNSQYENGKCVIFAWAFIDFLFTFSVCECVWVYVSLLCRVDNFFVFTVATWFGF